MSIYENRFHIHTVSAEQAAAGNHDAPGMSHYVNSWADVEALVAAYGWDRIGWISEGGADCEIRADYDVYTRRESKVLYTAPSLILKEQRMRQTAERAEAARRQHQQISLILKDGRTLRNLTVLETNSLRVIVADAGEWNGRREIGAWDIQQLAVVQAEPVALAA